MRMQRTASSLMSKKEKYLPRKKSLKIIRETEQRRPAMEALLRNYVDKLATKSPEAKAELESFMGRRSTKSASE